MKKILSVIVSLFTLLMFSGVALCAGAPAPVEKQKPAKVEKTKKQQHLKKSELTKGWDVSVNGGVAFLMDGDVQEDNNRATVETDPGYVFNVGVGYRLGGKLHPFRVEAELGYQKNEVDSASGRRGDDATGDMKAYTFLMNGYYDFVHGKKLVPYLTAGIGVAKVDADVNHIAHVDDIGLAYQVGVGLAYHISDNWHIDLRYRFMGVAEVDGMGLDNLNPEFVTNNVTLGLRYRF